jgi:glutamate-1-semialdehyde 2,1-aminomutase/spore coat polysaccharide biosynthesis protein SpsF
VTTAIIVQARFGSTRLPGKIVRPLGARTPLAYVLRRCARIPGADVVVCAVPTGTADDGVAELARACGAEIFRGPETDVLDRYLGAARAVGATTVMRVTSDCPLIDPTICGEVLAVLAASGADYVCNSLPPLWPHGLDCDAFSMAWLERAAAAANRAADREHVTLWLKRNPALTRINLDGPGGGIERHRWTLDFVEDLAFFRALWSVMGEGAGDAGTATILAMLDAHPEVVALNAALVDEPRLADRATILDRRVRSRLIAA